MGLMNKRFSIFQSKYPLDLEVLNGVDPNPSLLKLTNFASISFSNCRACFLKSTLKKRMYNEVLSLQFSSRLFTFPRIGSSCHSDDVDYLRSFQPDCVLVP